MVKSSHDGSSIYDSVFGLSDFGTSQFITSNTDQSFVDKYGTKAYGKCWIDIPLSLFLTTIQKTGAPECFRFDVLYDRRLIPIDQSVDIYSLGCVLSEVCVWIVSGVAGLEEYRRLRRSQNLGVARGADCFHIDGRTSQAVHRQHYLALGSVRCDRTTANILRLLPDLMGTDPACRPRAWMLSSVFNEFLSSDDARWSDRGAAMLHQLMSSEQISTTFEQQDRRFDDIAAPAEVVRGIRVRFSEQHDAMAARPAATDLEQASYPISIQTGTSDASKSVSSDHRQQETSPSSADTSTASRKRKGPSLGDPTSGSSSSMATSIDKPVRQRIPHYRLTREIIGSELQKIFPDYDLRAFNIQVNICSFIRLRSYHTNAELGVQRRFYFFSAPSADNGAQTPTLLGSLTNL